MDRDSPPVTGFLTDFGTDGAAAICHAVMLSICPRLRVVHISHTVPKYAISDGAFILRSALPHFPVGVHLAVVDPGVGSARRPLALRVARGDVLVGPDNGLLLPAAKALGGVVNARQLENRDLWLPVVSSTFHGRDIFSPVVAHLSNGDVPYEAVGGVVAVDKLVRFEQPQARAADGSLETAVSYVDSFGNLRLAGTPALLEEALGPIEPGRELEVSIGQHLERVAFAPTFSAVPTGAALLYVDSGGGLAIADNGGNVAQRLAVRTGAPVVIRPR